MNTSKRDILELRRRMTKKGCTFTRLSGCYVDGSKNVVLKFTERFSDLPEEEFYKYLEIAKKALSGSLGNNLLELKFQRSDTGNETQRDLYALKASRLERPEMLDRLYDRIIESYETSGNYLILMFHDVYDVVARSKDRKKLDESSESYEYVIAALCPVDFSKPGLSYREEEGRIGVSQRFWMVGAPDIGFTYPSFAGGSADSGSVLYYVRTGKDSHRELIEEVLACDPQRTAGEEKAAFQSVVQDAFEDPQQGKSVFLRVQKELSQITRPDPDADEEDPPKIALTAGVMSDLMERVDMPEEARDVIREAFQDAFGELPPQAGNVVDQKLVEESAQRLRTLELETQVTDLREELKTQGQELREARTSLKAAQALNPSVEGAEDPAIALRVREQKAKKIHAQMISGVKYLVIPLETGDVTRINGEEYDF